MKVKGWILMIVCFLIGTVSFAQDKELKKEKKKLEEVTFVVSMNCHKCQQKIEKNIPWEKGVKDLHVNLDDKKVTIKYDPNKTDVAKLRTAFEKLDYTATEVNN